MSVVDRQKAWCAGREYFKSDVLIQINEELIRRCRVELNNEPATLGDILRDATNPLAGVSTQDLQKFKDFIRSLSVKG